MTIKAFIPYIPDVLDAVAEWWEEEEGTHVPTKRIGSGIEILNVLDLKELHTCVDGVDRIFQYAPEVERYHWHEFNQETNVLDTITDYDLQQALLTKMKAMEGKCKT